MLVRGERKMKRMNRRKSSMQGFTLLEVVFSTSLLAIAMLGLALMIPVAAQSNSRNRIDSEGSTLVQQELEQILAQGLSTTSFIDVNGNQISIGAGGCALTTSGPLDYSTAAPNGYSAIVTGTSGGRYELRWNVQALADSSKQFTIAAKRTGGIPYLLPPVNIVARRGAQ